MNAIVRRCGLLVLVTSVAVSRAGAQNGSSIRDLIVEDSLTPAKAQLRDFVAELRDSLVHVESVQARLEKARASNMTSVVMSQGRELARTCASSATIVALTIKRIEPMNTKSQTGDQALNAYRNALSTLGEDLRRCAHADSLVMASAPVDQQKLEGIATAARAAITQYDVICDGLMKLLGITLPIKGTVWRH